MQVHPGAAAACLFKVPRRHLLTALPQTPPKIVPELGTDPGLVDLMRPFASHTKRNWIFPYAQSLADDAQRAMGVESRIRRKALLLDEAMQAAGVTQSDLPKYGVNPNG